MSELEALGKGYQEIKHVRARDFLSEAELDSIEESAIYNVKNAVFYPRNLSRFMTTVRLQYLCDNM